MKGFAEGTRLKYPDADCAMEWDGRDFLAVCPINDVVMNARDESGALHCPQCGRSAANPTEAPS